MAPLFLLLPSLPLCQRLLLCMTVACEARSHNPVWSLYKAISTKESFFDVGIHCDYITIILKESSLEHAFLHFEECASVFAQDLRWHDFLASAFPVPDETMVGFFFLFFNSSPHMLTVSLFHLQKSIADVFYRLRIRLYVMDNYVRLMMTKAGGNQHFHQWVSEYLTEYTELEKTAKVVLEREEGEEKEERENRANITSLLKEYKARFNWHFAIELLRLFGLPDEIPSRVDAEHAQALHHAVNSLIVTLGDPPQEQPRFIRELGDERVKVVSRLLLAVIRSFDKAVLGDHQSEKEVAVSRNANWRENTFDSFLRALQPEKEDSIPKVFEILEDYAVDEPPGDLADLRQFVLSAAPHVNRLEEWLRTLFPALSDPSKEENGLEEEEQITLREVQLFIAILLIDAFEETRSLGHAGLAWYDLLLNSSSWHPTQHQHRFWITLLQDHVSEVLFFYYYFFVFFPVPA